MRRGWWAYAKMCVVLSCTSNWLHVTCFCEVIPSSDTLGFFLSFFFFFSLLLLSWVRIPAPEERTTGRGKGEGWRVERGR